MCAIAGELRTDGRRASAGVVERMCSLMEARGPDGGGIFAQNEIALGHRRLKIIDISDRSSQPMSDSYLDASIVFNGAIYNYQELRGTLEGMGFRFFSSGDTEVLLKAYRAWGDRFVERLNGMFAFALWDKKEGRLLCGRDRLGIKPFYYSEISGAFRFASALPALASSGGVDTTLDKSSLHNYMTFHSVVPAPATILRGIRKLPPATVLSVDRKGRKRMRTYWKLSFSPRAEDRGKGREEWSLEILACLRKSVRRRLVADVPVGVLLSGGLDSSLVVGLLAQEGQRRLETFSIGFESVGGLEGDEFRYSDVVANRFATKHRKLRISGREMLSALDACVGSMSEPMVSHDNIGFYLLSREVARSVRVVQSGQGADEVFGGYHWYPPLAESKRPANDYARVFFDRTHEDLKSVLSRGWTDRDYSGEFVKRHFALSGARRPVDKALRIDTTVMLVDDPVKRVDNMTMAWGLEARVPFLDHELVETAARIPSKFKLAEGGKGVLKHAARSVIPHEVIDRPKGYFPVPGLTHLRGDALRFVREHALGPSARRRAVFKRSYVEKLLKSPDGHLTPLGGSKLWQIALLNFWLDRHGL